MTKPFDARNINHVRAYRSFAKTGGWPIDDDVYERTHYPLWVLMIQSKLAEAYVADTLGEDNEDNTESK